MNEVHNSGKMAFIPWSTPERMLYMDKDKASCPLRTITMDMIRN